MEREAEVGAAPDAKDSGRVLERVTSAHWDNCPQNSCNRESACWGIRKRQTVMGSSAQRCVQHRVEYPNRVWSCDFVAEQTAVGCRLKGFVENEKLRPSSHGDV